MSEGDRYIAERKATTNKSDNFAQPSLIANGHCSANKRHRLARLATAEPAFNPMFRMGFRVIGTVTVILPFGALIVCFVTAIIFHFEAVNRTSCNVTNVVPSISAIIGVTPQRYIWRICISLHSTPRFIIGFAYRFYFLERESFVHAIGSIWYQRVVNLTCCSYVVENACLIGITYISSAENYPVHEKLFIVFMVSSLLYELLTIFLFSWCHPKMNRRVMWSYRLKQTCFTLIILFTAGLLYFFYLHRFHCIPGAFTKFACCEYVIVVLNISYHSSAVYDFSDLDLHFVNKPRIQTDTNDNHKNR